MTDIPGTELYSPRDWRREAVLAVDNKAVLRVFAEFREARMSAMIEAGTIEERERARVEYLAALAIEEEIEALATMSDD